MQFKFISLVCVIMLTVAACSEENNNETQDTESVSAEIMFAFSGLADAVKNLDHETYFSYFDEHNYTALNEDGSVLHSLTAFKEMYLPQVAYIQNYNDLTFSNVKIDVIDANTAILVNEYSAEVVLTTGDIVAANGAGTQVWSKLSGTWKLVNVSSSSKPSVNLPAD